MDVDLRDRSSSLASSRRLRLWVALGAVLCCLGFAAWTGHIWEDFFITFRASLNLATGHGLVFQPGERVHSFTSPLGTLLPALFALGGGEDVATRAIWGLRLASALAFSAALWLALDVMRREAAGGFALGVAALAWIFDAKMVDYAINGMECAFVVFFVVLTWRAFATGARLRACALGVAGLQWTRPDGFVFFGAVALAWLALGESELSRAQRLRRILLAGLLGLLLYAPWLVFAWSYYGSPVPHTIMAKMGLRHVELADLLLYPWKLLFGHVSLHDTFKPAYYYFGGWRGAGESTRFFATIAAVAWLVPGIRPAGRLASAAFFLGGFYLQYIPGSPWYLPGWQALALISWAGLLDRLIGPASKGQARPSAVLGRVAGVGVVLLQVAMFLGVAWQMRWQQQIIEDGNRAHIGRWLRREAAPGDRVFLEPLGYIGYFSRLKMLDYPGLCAPEVVAARRAGHTTYGQVIAALRPEWLVLRSLEVENFDAASRQMLDREYRLARAFDVRAQVDAVKFLPGRGYVNFDSVFRVYRRLDSTP